MDNIPYFKENGYSSVQSPAGGAVRRKPGCGDATFQWAVVTKLLYGIS